MKVDAGRGKLDDALEVLLHQWRDVCEKWSDRTNAEFREHTFEPLERLTSECLRCIDRLRSIFNECHRQCEGRDI